MNDKHLLWWVFKAVHACRAEGVRRETLLSETLWKNLGAPNWVLPSLREKYDQFDDGKALNSISHPPGLIDKLAEAISDGRLSLTPK